MDKLTQFLSRTLVLGDGAMGTMLQQAGLTGRLARGVER